MPSFFSLVVGPILQAKPEPVSVDVGEDASFSCAWRGNPLPRVTWTRRGGVQVTARLGLDWQWAGFLPTFRALTLRPVPGAGFRAHAAYSVGEDR